MKGGDYRMLTLQIVPALCESKTQTGIDSGRPVGDSGSAGIPSLWLPGNPIPDTGFPL